MYTSNREGKREGGVALIAHDNIKVKLIDDKNCRTFQYTKWLLTTSHSEFTCIVLYHPSYTNSTKLTNQDFLDEFTEWSTHMLADNNNLLLLGDLNIYIDEENDNDANNFRDTMEARGIIQHVKFSMHKANHIKDHIYTELFSDIKVTGCGKGDLISDHHIIVFNTSIPKPKLTTIGISYRKLKKVNPTDFAQKISNTTYPGLNSRIEALKDQLSKALDELAPLTTKRLNARWTVPWFTDHIIDLKRSMRRKHKKWKKYRGDDHWKAFTIEWNKYRWALKQAKIAAMSQWIKDCGHNTKALYKLMSEITGSQLSNPLPNTTSEFIAEEFANYFIDKINKICSNLDKHDKCKPSHMSLNQTLSNFKPMTNDHVIRIINNMTTESCESDPIPTTIFMKVVPIIKDEITAIINISLLEVSLLTSRKMPLFALC